MDACDVAGADVAAHAVTVAVAVAVAARVLSLSWVMPLCDITY